MMQMKPPLFPTIQIQCSKKETFRPGTLPEFSPNVSNETAPFFLYNIVKTATHSWENPGPVSGRKVSFF